MKEVPTVLQHSYLSADTESKELHPQNLQRCLQTETPVSNQNVGDQKRNGTTEWQTEDQKDP